MNRDVTRRDLLRAVGGATLGAGVLGTGALGAQGSGRATAAPAGFVTPPTVPGWTDRFCLGVANSGFQAEGHNPDSNWKRYTDRAAASGSVDPVGNAVDFRHRYREDILLAKDMGLNTFRFGIEWARVEPRRGHVDPVALAFYDDVVATIRSLGMCPMITLLHYVYPGWVVDRGGFLGARTLGDWTRHVEMITARYAGADTMWITINEPVVFFGHEMEIGAVTASDLSRFLDRVAQAHRVAHRAAHRADPASRVGANEAFLPAVTPAVDAMFFDRVRDTLDFVGIDFYYGAALSNLTAIYGATADFAKIRPQPDDIYQACHHYAQAYPGTPIYIVENGMPTDDGRPRADGYTRGNFIEDTLFWLQRARGEGLPVVGHNHWSITDNYEWGTYSSRFGLYQVDVRSDPTLTRRPTTGVAAYRRMAAGRGPAFGYRPVMAPAVGSAARVPQSVFSPSRIDGPRALL
ncbi:family 1 glycosylhydrolase [Gordonia sp. NPDC003376]